MKRILFLLVASFIASNIYCQINFGKLGTDILVDNSIKGGISIIKSEYQLRSIKDGGLYGRGGKDVYGSVYYVGINIPTGLLAMSDIQKPWLTDSDFDKYRNNESYEPVLKTIKVFSAQESDTVSCTELKPKTEVVYNSDSSLVLLKDIILKNNFDLKIESDIKDSWIVWFAVDKGQALTGFDNLDFNTVYQKQDQDINGKDVKTPLGTNILLGGIVLTPNITGVGKIELQLVALLKKESNSWKISSLPKEFLKNGQNSSEKPASATAIDNPKGDDDELTPIKSKSNSTTKAKSKKKK